MTLICQYNCKHESYTTFNGVRIIDGKSWKTELFVCWECGKGLGELVFPIHYNIQNDKENVE